MSKYSSYFLVFVASFCLMVAEIVAGRLTAPHVGSSIYTWTGIIGIFLLGITLGNWIGGRIADRYPRVGLFGLIFLMSALSALAITFIVPGWAAVPKMALSFPVAITVFSFITFFPVAFFLSFVTPLAIKLELNRLERTGRTVGNVYGVSAAGSIIGTFAAGFWLIPSLGTKQIIWGIFVLLALIGSYFLVKGGSRKALVLFVGLIPLGIWSFNQKGICHIESQYYCIRINKIEIGNHEGYALMLDQLEHSHVWSAGFDPFGDNYIRLFALLTNYRFKPDDTFKVLAIGGGGYTLPRYLINNFPRATVTVLEIDPKVTEVNYQKLGLAPNERLNIIHADGRVGLQQLTEKFDLVYGDAFSDFLIPFHLTTKELVEEIKSRLNPGSIYAINLVDGTGGDSNSLPPQLRWVPRQELKPSPGGGDSRPRREPSPGKGSRGRFLASSLITIGSVFPHTYLFPFKAEWQDLRRHTSVIVGATEILDEKLWAKVSPLNDPRWSLAPIKDRENVKLHFSIDDPSIKTFLTSTRGKILTDNFAPVERMISHLYRK